MSAAAHILTTKLCVQAFVNTSFENISSTGLALDLLLQFESILQRDTLKVPPLQWPARLYIACSKLLQAEAPHCACPAHYAAAKPCLNTSSGHALRSGLCHQNTA